MMKARTLGASALAGALVVSLAGCGGNVPGPLGALIDRNTPTDQATSAVDDAADGLGNSVAATSKEDLDSEIEEEEEYCITDGEDDDTLYHVIVFKNTSSKTVEVSSNSELSYDDEGIVGVGEATLSGVGPNCTGALYEEIDDEHEGDGEPSLDTTLSAREDEHCAAIQNLSTETSIKGGKAFVRVTNNDKTDADSVAVTVLFFDGSEAVACEEDGYPFALEGLKSGKSKTQAYEPEYDVEFDSVKVYVSGYADEY